MPYIEPDGTMDRERKWSMSYLVELLWGPINFMVLFFQTLINPRLTSRGDGYESNYGASSSGGPPGPPRRRLGRLHGMGGASPPPAGG